MPPILFQDQRFVILDKPAGLAVHAGPRGGPSVEDWFPQLSRRRDGPWLAHRLDADTSGCLVVALRKTALLDAQRLFATGQVRKVYWAVVHGAPREASGTVEAALLKRTTPQGWRMVADPGGTPASTEWRVLAHDPHPSRSAPEWSWLELRPQTGRTHQIRVHCAMLGCPILGDPLYGNPANDRNAEPLQLLARSIDLPLTPPVTATAPVPGHMTRIASRQPA